VCIVLFCIPPSVKYKIDFLSYITERKDVTIDVHIWNYLLQFELCNHTKKCWSSS